MKFKAGDRAIMRYPRGLHGIVTKVYTVYTINLIPIFMIRVQLDNGMTYSDSEEFFRHYPKQLNINKIKDFLNLESEE